MNVSPYEYEQRIKDEVEEVERWFASREPFSWPDWCRLHPEREDNDSSGDTVPTWWMAL